MVDWTSWTHWWAYNSPRYLRLRESVQSVTVLSQECLPTGEAADERPNSLLKPSDRQLRTVAVPAILNALRDERSKDVVSAALVALAKIGGRPDRPAETELFAATIASFLSDPSQEVAETAAIALGILADAASVPRLVALLRDDQTGRKLVGGRAEVPARTRAFAAHGLGLVAHARPAPERRREIAAELVAVLDAPDHATPDLKAAALIALGLTPLEVAEGEGGSPTRGSSPERATRSLDTQLDYVLDLVDPRRRRANGGRRSDAWLAFAPTTIARLVAAFPAGVRREEAKARAFASLERLLGPHSRVDQRIRQSAVLAFGALGDCDDDESDVGIRAELVRLCDQGTPVERRFALISLARQAARAGRGERPLAGLAAVRAELARRFTRAHGTLRPWAALALGVLGRERLDEGGRTDVAIDALLRTALTECVRPEEAGSLLVALGLRRDARAVDSVLNATSRFRGSDEARGYACVALGMIGQRRAVEPLLAIVEEARHRPTLMVKASIGLGVLGYKMLGPELVEQLGGARSMATQAAFARALGTIGDSRAVEPLEAFVADPSNTALARSFGIVALGLVCDKEMLPWSEKIGRGLNYVAATTTLIGGGLGVLEIL